MRIVYYRIYLLFLLASLAMLTHFSALCCLTGSWGVSPSADGDHGLRPLDSCHL